MAYDPKIGDTVTIHSETYKFLWNKATAKDLHLVDAREGGEGIVYRVSSHHSSAEYYALKIFNNNLESNFARFISDSTSRLSAYRDLPGLKVCDRKLVRSFSDCPESQQYPELQNAVLMPWIMGYTWHDIIVGYQNEQSSVNLTQSMCFTLANSIAKILAGLEKNGLAHCDIASGNIIFDLGKNLVELIDVEDMYFPNSVEPKHKPLGSKGYRHPNTKKGIWFAEADRFAGAVLISEILAWGNPQVRKYVDDDTFFANDELGQYSEKYQAVYDELRTHYSPELAILFETAWYSDNMNSCYPLSDWIEELSQYKQSQVPNLQVSPLHLDFGTIDKQKTLVLSVSNSGKGVLRGNLSEADSSWLSIGQRAFELHAEETCSIGIRVVSLPNLISNSVLINNITVESNAGQQDIAVSGKVGNRHSPPPPNPWPAIGCGFIIAFIGFLLFLILIAILTS